MEAAFGLAVTLTMLMSTVLIAAYLYSRRVSIVIVILLTALFLTIEITFLVANLIKFEEGGWISMLIGLALIAVMWLWFRGREYRRKLIVFEKMEPFVQTLKELSNDKSLPQYASHLIYLTTSNSPERIEAETILSIFLRRPRGQRLLQVRLQRVDREHSPLSFLRWKMCVFGGNPEVRKARAFSNF